MEGGRVGECPRGGVVEYYSTSCWEDGQGVGDGEGVVWDRTGGWQRGAVRVEEERECAEWSVRGI